MEKAAYINSVSAYLPNSPIANEDMEDYIGKIGGNPSRVRSIVLRQNGIKTRYYGLDKNQSLTHSNAELAKEAVCGLFENGNILDDLTLLACGTSTPDQLLPSHASMVHGELANYPMEIFSSTGVCLTSLQALKICYSNILAGNVYPCQSFHYKEYRMGNLLADSIEDIIHTQIHKDIAKNFSIDNIPTCKDCKVKYICSGGCRAATLNIEGKPTEFPKTLCPYYKEKAINMLKSIPKQ